MPEVQVEALARELADTINAEQVDGRERLREVALSLLRDEVRLSEPLPAAADAPVATGAFNPFGIGIPLVLMGSVLVFLSPSLPTTPPPEAKATCPDPWISPISARVRVSRSIWNRFFAVTPITVLPLGSAAASINVVPGSHSPAGVSSGRPKPHS